MYDFSKFKSQVAETNEWLRTEYQAIRTGRATPALLDTVQVDVYGSRMPIAQVANVGVEDARTLRVAPYDNSQIKELEKAIADADLGVGVSAGSDSVRVIFPELTAERRDLLIKTAKDKLEDAHQSIRGARDEVWAKIQESQRNGEMSEDDKFTAKDEMEQIVSDANKRMDELFTKKENEISE